MKAVPLFSVRFIKNNVYLMNVVSCYYLSTRFIILIKAMITASLTKNFIINNKNSLLNKPEFHPNIN